MKIIVKQYSVKKGDKFESPNGDYKYIIKDIDYSSTPNMVQMMYADSGSIHKLETFPIKLPVLLSCKCKAWLSRRGEAVFSNSLTKNSSMSSSATPLTTT